MMTSAAFPLANKRCACAKDIEKTWSLVSDRDEISFDEILEASSRVTDCTPQWQQCENQPRVASTPGELLLQIYERLVEFHHAATVTYTSDHLGGVGEPRVVAARSAIQLGTYTLDGDESQQIALDLITASLRNLIDMLRQIKEYNAGHNQAVQDKAAAVNEAAVTLLGYCIAAQSRLSAF